MKEKEVKKQRKSKTKGIRSDLLKHFTMKICNNIQLRTFYEEKPNSLFNF